MGLINLITGKPFTKKPRVKRDYSCKAGYVNDEDRQEWILNDEYLYRWWKQSHLAMGVFINKHRAELKAYIVNKLNK